MIKVHIFAGLGNQLFEYAYARALSLEYNEPIIIYPKTALMLLVKLRFPKIGKTSYQLKYFNITPCEMQNPIISFIESIPPVIHACLHRLKQEDDKKMTDLFLKMTAKGKHYYADTATGRYFAHCHTDKKIKHVHGNWVSAKYFDHYSETIRNELRVNTPLFGQNQLTIEEMQSCNSVAVHFRRGDYVNEKKYNTDLNICSTDYYKRGMRYIAEHTLNPVFYIFSNDISWIKKNVIFEYPVKYMEYNNPAHEDLRLMYNCKHFIIPNSTFSWWGSYLSDNPDKITIAPSYWSRRYPNWLDLCRDEMVLLNPDEE